MDNEYKRLSRMLDMNSLQKCNAGYVDADDCSWYHTNWIRLRQLGLVSNPFWHEQFYMEHLSKYATPNAKVLILGTADFSMPYLTKLAGVDELSVSDICLTPLNVCDFIATKEGYKWRTFVGDIRKGLGEQYDVITNDAFLTRFPHSETKSVLTQISHCLRPNGRYVTTIRLGGIEGDAIIPSNEEKADFIYRAVERTKELDVDFDEAMAKQTAQQYIDNMISYSIVDVDALHRLCDGIFTIEQIDSATVQGECVESTYCKVVFSKL